MSDVIHDLFQNSITFQQRHAEAVRVISSTTDGSSIIDKVLPLLVDPSATRAHPPQWRRGSAARSAVLRGEIEAAVITTWLRGALDRVQSSARVDDVDARWAALERLEREVSEIGRRLLLDNTHVALTRLLLLTRILSVHAMLLLEMRREDYGERRGRFADTSGAAACFELYASVLRRDLTAAVTERLASIESNGQGVTDPWATEEFKKDWLSWYAKVRVFDPKGCEFQHYLARVLRDFTLDLQEQVIDVVRRTAELVGAPADAWYAVPGVLRYGDVVQLQGGSLWPLVDGDDVGADGVLQDDASGGWTLVSATDRPGGSEIQTGEPFHLRSTSGERFLHDASQGGRARVGDAPQTGGSFFLRAMEVKPGKIAMTHTTYFLVGVHSDAYLQTTADGALLLRPWRETHHAGPDFPSWSFFVEKGPARMRALSAQSMTDLNVTLTVFDLLSTLPEVGPLFSLLGTVVGFLWPKEPVPTWSEIKAYFKAELGKALAEAELGSLANFMDGIERRLTDYQANVKFVKDQGNIEDPIHLQNLSNELKRINDDLVQDLSNFLYPVNATPLDTLPYYWRVARYKLCVLKELGVYENTSVDVQHQLDSFINESRPVLVNDCIARLMRERMNAISSTPERYNEAFGAYLLRYRDGFTGKVFNVSNRDFLTTSNCTASVNYPAYNDFAKSELAKYRNSVRNEYLAAVVSMQVDPFNAMAELSTNTKPISLKASGNDGWSLT